MTEELQSWNDLVDLDNYEEENNLLIIDGNNLAFRWLNRANHSDYYEDYVRTIKSLAKSYRAKRVICCYDFGHSYYRKAIRENYKANRLKPKEPEEVKKYDEFFNCLNSIIDQLPLENYKFRGVEADDLIAYFAINLENIFDHTWIISSDKDLYQIISNKVSIFNMYQRREITEDSILEDSGLTIDETLLAMLIRGDKGDNIEGVKGIGIKRSEALAREFKTLSELILALPIKRKSKYIQNLNSSKNLILENEKMINLKNNHMQAIKAGKDGEKNIKILEKALEE